MSKLTWNDLFLSGSVVHLHTSSWRAKLRLKPADLGIDDSDSVSKALALGRYRLAPREAFEEIDELIAKCRRTIDHYSLPFGFLKGARYVPANNLREMSDKLRECRVAFASAVDSFMKRYDEMKAEMLPVIKQALEEAARTPEAAVNAYNRVLAEYPSSDEVREKFRLRWLVYEIQGPKAQGAEAALESEGETVRSAVRDMMAELREEVTTKLADVLTLINKGGKLQARSIESVRAVLDHVDRVNIMGDQVLRNQVRAIRGVLAGLDEGRVPDATVAGLSDIKAMLESDLDAAVAAAEARLTGVGKRKLEVA